MAVPAVPFWLSQAQDEFKKPRPGFITDTLAAAGLPGPRWCSELAGKSAQLNFTLTVGEYYPGYETQMGFNEFCGNCQPRVYQGGTISSLFAYDDQPNAISFSIGLPNRALTLWIDGAGTVAFTTTSRGDCSIPWGGIYPWLAARKGKNIACSIK